MLRGMCSYWQEEHTWVHLRTRRTQQISRAVYFLVEIFEHTGEQSERSPWRPTNVVLCVRPFNVGKARIEIVFLMNKLVENIFYRRGFVRIISSSQNETGFGVTHSSSGQISIFETRPLNIDHSLCPNRYLENHSHCGVEFHWRQQHDKIVLIIIIIIEIVFILNSEC